MIGSRYEIFENSYRSPGMNAFTKFEVAMLETADDEKAVATHPLDVRAIGSNEFALVMGGGVVGNFD